MSDNLRCNQSKFNDSRKKYGTSKEWSINHPIPNSDFDLLFLLNDPNARLEKYLTQRKNQRLIKKTILNYYFLYPINFEKHLCSVKHF